MAKVSYNRVMKQCQINDCNKTKFCREYCTMHYSRLQRGQPLTGNSRFDHRPAIIEGAIARIPLGVNAQRGYGIVDSEDSHLDRYNWSIGGRGYASAYIDGKVRKLHQLVMSPTPEGMEIDHKDRNKLNNRRSNLRFVPHYVNARNIGAPSTNTSGVLGVTYDKDRKKWAAKIHRGDKCINLGRYATLEEAAAARREAEIKRDSEQT